MNRLDTKTRAQILRSLVEGNSILATSRMTDTSKEAVLKLLVDAGRACASYQDRVLRDLPCKRVQVDEIWSFTYAKQKNVAKAKAAPEGAGDTWTWTAICADTKLAISWLVGGRDATYATAFLQDCYERLAGRIQLTSDRYGAYNRAVRDVFGIDVDWAMLVKIYGGGETGQGGGGGRYSPGECKGIRKDKMIGKPDPAHISTSYVERQNLTMRMHMRRFTRLTNAFSKKLENHAHAVSLHFFYYNFIRIHQSLRVTPAMAANVTERIWDVEDIVTLIDEATPAPAKRGPYKKKAK
ncbi:MAG: IS1 family transposase [Hyphomonadaceae bacterium]|nr:IS1 family transposase [Hyphomonadaceae bacterium]